VLLAIDTSTSLVSVAVCAATDARLLAAGSSDRPMAHGESLAPLVHSCLQRAGVRPEGLTTIGVGTGPGPFTGLRVGLVTARVLGLAVGVPVRGVCSLDVVAAQAVSAGVTEPFVVVTDARRKELFHAAYDAAGRRTHGPHVSRPGDVLAGRRTDTLVVGPGAAVHPGAFARTSGPDRVEAATLAALLLREGAEVTDPEPRYLRRPDAVVPGPPKKAS
jgi:tRNA threonylcarbamoyladenosine biosynthesis protein TsaB